MTRARQVGLDIPPDYSNALVTEPAASGSAHLDDWALARFALRNSLGLCACADGTPWSADGRLLGLSRQVRRVSKTV